MRHVILAVVAVALASTAVALAGNPSWVWTEPKAERIVARDARSVCKGPIELWRLSFGHRLGSTAASRWPRSR